MNSYEILLDEAQYWISSKGKATAKRRWKKSIKGNKIAIRHDIKTSRQKANVLAEELGHYYTSTGRFEIVQTGEPETGTPSQITWLQPPDRTYGNHPRIQCWMSK